MHHRHRSQGILSVEQPTTAAPTDLPHVDPQRGEQREVLALEDAAKRAERIGVGVTREAQSVFDALWKTMPCKWDKTSIGESAFVARAHTPRIRSADRFHSCASISRSWRGRHQKPLSRGGLLVAGQCRSAGKGEEGAVRGAQEVVRATRKHGGRRG